MISLSSAVNYCIIGLFVAYIAHTISAVYEMFYPNPCLPSNSNKCIAPRYSPDTQLELRIYTSLKEKPTARSHYDLLWRKKDFTSQEEFEISVNVSLPLPVINNNGSFYCHVFLSPQGHDPIGSRQVASRLTYLTKHMLPRESLVNLLNTQEATPETKDERPVTHWRPHLMLRVLSEPVVLDRTVMPADIAKYLQLISEKEYLPLLYVEDLSLKMADYLEINSTSFEMPLRIVYKPISLGIFRLLSNMEDSMKMMKELGFSDKDIDEVKGLFVDINFHLLVLTFFVSTFHLLFDFLAFKNDISFWRNRKTTVGLSSRMILWRCVSQMIIFLYLLDEKTSLLVLVPAGIGSIIEAWKAKKAIKLEFYWLGWRPSCRFGAILDSEKETEAYDSAAMKYLSYLLYPLCVGGALYSVFYVEHKSWYSWGIHSLVNGVYAFGFLFMLPQLFVNYKLKSVAHLPWKAFTYKAFNTFIDDLFAFIITMPTAHRIACFRDDVVFLVYLYQRWLYPVDHSRVNEYGESFEQSTDSTKEHRD